MWRQLDRVLKRIRFRRRGCSFALVLSGGGARAAYQAGVLRYIADEVGEAHFQIITGVSAGSINAAQLANSVYSFNDSVGGLVACWESLTSGDVYEAKSSMNVLLNLIRDSRKHDEFFPRFGLVDTDPLRKMLQNVMDTPDGRLSGIARNLDSGVLDACSIAGTNYGTGQTVSFVEGSEIEGWERPARRSINEELTIEHIMASSSLPFLFPAVEVNGEWYGDGGIRQAEPLSPAVHLGADRILAISTRYGRSKREAAQPATEGYPPAAQIFGILLNAIFLDRLDQDAATLARLNELIRDIPPWVRHGLRPIDLLVIRPSIDLGRLSGDFQHDLEGFLNLVARGLGSKDTESPDWLSMILFEPAYMQRLIETGYSDGRSNRERLMRFFDTDMPWDRDGTSVLRDLTG